MVSIPSLREIITSKNGRDVEESGEVKSMVR